MPTAFIPTQLRHLSGKKANVPVDGTSVAEVIAALDRLFPGFRNAVIEDDDIRPGLAVAINSEVTPLGLLADVGPNDEVHFVPAIGGGGLEAVSH